MCRLIFLSLALVLTKKSANTQTTRRNPDTLPIENWTTCEEFLNNTNFDPESVVNIDWKIFYFWNTEFEESYNIRFSRPSSVLVDRYRVELDEEMKQPVNWTDAELFMETTIDFSALFLKTERPGLFRVIPSVAFDYEGMPLMIFALKVVEPGYLGIANCKHRICYALAPVDKMPFHYELEKAARTLQFYNDFNRSHIALRAMPSMEAPFAADLPDDDQDDDLEVEQDLDKVEFF